MPVEGFVDPDRHRACYRCGKWFEANEGSIAHVGATSGAAVALSVIAAFLPGHLQTGSRRFVCFGCQRKRRRFRWILYASFAAVILLVLVLQALKVI